MLIRRSRLYKGSLASFPGLCVIRVTENGGLMEKQDLDTDTDMDTDLLKTAA